MKKIFIFIIIMFIGLGSCANENLIFPAQRGLVTAVEYVDLVDSAKQIVNVKLLTGQFKGQEIELDNMLTDNPIYDIFLKAGDRVILHQEASDTFIEDINGVDFFIADIERVNAIYFLVAVFCFLLFFIGRKKGVMSFISILATVALIFWLLVPMILSGICPILAVLIVSVLSTIITIYSVGGFNYKSTSAIIGTVLCLVISATLSIITIALASLTGFIGEESSFLYATRPDLSFLGILCASIMLASLGAVMDVAVSIASTVNEIYTTDNGLTVKDLFKSGMNVGKDIIGTMSNTLILVYIGSSLPLVLLSNNIDAVKFFNLNLVVTEISSALIGSISILACVPLTAVISAFLIKTKSTNEIELAK